MKRQVIPNSHHLMYGVIAGDMIGKPYERRKDFIYTTDFPLFEKRSMCTDDTILTVAIMKRQPRPFRISATTLL